MDTVVMTTSERRAAGRGEYHHYVYVVELSKDVLHEAKFLNANPHYDRRKAVRLRRNDRPYSG